MSDSNSHMERAHLERAHVEGTHAKDSTGQPDHSQDKPLNFFQMVHSVGASFFGVQSSENRERDFKRGNARQFIMVAILMTIIWYGAIATLVHFVLPD